MDGIQHYPYALLVVDHVNGLNEEEWFPTVGEALAELEAHKAYEWLTRAEVISRADGLVIAEWTRER
jgi:hypothetical protein